MDYVIGGGKRLQGELPVDGAKNCALAFLGATVLTDDEVAIENCPVIDDVENMLKLLAFLGKSVRREGTLVTVSGAATCSCVPQECAKLLRGSGLVLGSLVAKNGQAVLPSTGGCAIGSRPIDIHLDGLRALGVDVKHRNDVVCTRKPLGGTFSLRFPSVGATENLLCASSLAKSVVTLRNCALEPEVVALERALVQMGAKISGIGKKIVTICGVRKLHGARLVVIPDRIVAATYLACGVATKGSVLVSKCNPAHLSAFCEKLSCFDLTVFSDAISINASKMPSGYGHTVTGPYPAFPTDMQQILTSLCALSDGGRSVVVEKVFENRLKHNAMQLNAMGANVRVSGDRAVIEGAKLHGAHVVAGDLRGGAGLVVAALGADGKTTIGSVEHVLRGYCNLAERLASVGADISVEK